MKYQITKIFRFEAGHRVWTQNLSRGRGSSLSGSDVCNIENKCRHIHGHSYVLEITIGSDDLENGMVMDFYHLKTAVKKLVDDLDHSFIVDKNDPIFPRIKEIADEFGLKLFIVDFVPTAEALAEYIFKYVDEKFKEAGIKNVKVLKVVLWETSTSKAEYGDV